VAEPEKVKVSEATRRWRELLDGVAQGKQYLITRDGTPVASLGPVPAEPTSRSHPRYANQSGPYNDAAVVNILRTAFPGRKKK
jgi:prevent-host-death family protein